MLCQHELTIDGAEYCYGDGERPAAVALAAKDVEANEDEDDDGEQEEHAAEDLADCPPC